MEFIVNNKFHYFSSGTDGHRPVGRPWHAFRWKNSTPGEVISWSTRNRPPLPHCQMIRSPRHLMIRGFCLCRAALKPKPILAGRFRPQHGQPCSSVSNKGNRSATSPVITACPMRRSGVYFVPPSSLSGSMSTDHPRS